MLTEPNVGRMVQYKMKIVAIHLKSLSCYYINEITITYKLSLILSGMNGLGSSFFLHVSLFEEISALSSFISFDKLSTFFSNDLHVR